RRPHLRHAALGDRHEQLVTPQGLSRPELERAHAATSTARGSAAGFTDGRTRRPGVALTHFNTTSLRYPSFPAQSTRAGRLVARRTTSSFQNPSSGARASQNSVTLPNAFSRAESITCCNEAIGGHARPPEHAWTRVTQRANGSAGQGAMGEQLAPRRARP